MPYFPIKQTLTCKGWYKCIQGVTQLTLTLKRVNFYDVEGLFDFSVGQGADKGCRGAFKMRGTVDPETNSLRMDPGPWVSNPCGYKLVGLSGQAQLMVNGDLQYSGSMTMFADTCKEFEASCNPSPASACVVDGVLDALAYNWQDVLDAAAGRAGNAYVGELVKELYNKRSAILDKVKGALLRGGVFNKASVKAAIQGGLSEAIAASKAAANSMAQGKGKMLPGLVWDLLNSDPFVVKAY